MVSQVGQQEKMNRNTSPIIDKFIFNKTFTQLICCLFIIYSSLVNGQGCSQNVMYYFIKHEFINDCSGVSIR